MYRRKQADAYGPVSRMIMWTVIVIVILVGFSSHGEREKTQKSENGNTKMADEREIHIPDRNLERRRRLSQPPPMWGQLESDMFQTSAFSSTVLLLMVTTKRLTIIRRSIESILEATSGSGMNLIVCLQDPSQETMELLGRYPLKIHVGDGSFIQEGDDDKEEEEEEEEERRGELRGGGSSLLGRRRSLGRFLGVSSLMENFKDLIGIPKTGVCARDTVSPTFNVLNTDLNSTWTSTYSLTVKEIENTTRGVPFEMNPYNPIYRKAVRNSRSEGLEKDSHFSSKCQKAENLREALAFSLNEFPKLQHLILLESGYQLASNFLRYLEQTLGSLKEDPSLYCISSHNPLSSPLTSTDPTKVYRVEHFVSRGTLIPKRLAEEIVRDFVLYEETSHRLSDSALDILETWLSWWSRRRRRACIVPDVPRICPLDLPAEGAEGNRMNSCSPVTVRAEVNASRLIHYQYSQDIYWKVVEAEPLGRQEKDCRKENFFPKEMNTSLTYALYIKMENYDDDFTFHHVMKCFGLDLSSTVGHFEGIFLFTFRHTHFLVMGVPYSRFSPALKDPGAVILADMGGEYKTGRMQYLKHKNENFTFSNLPIKQIIA